MQHQYTITSASIDLGGYQEQRLGLHLRFENEEGFLFCYFLLPGKDDKWDCIEEYMVTHRINHIHGLKGVNVYITTNGSGQIEDWNFKELAS